MESPEEHDEQVLEAASRLADVVKELGISPENAWKLHEELTKYIKTYGEYMLRRWEKRDESVKKWSTLSVDEWANLKIE